MEQNWLVAVELYPEGVVAQESPVPKFDQLVFSCMCQPEIIELKVFVST